MAGGSILIHVFLFFQLKFVDEARAQNKRILIHCAAGWDAICCFHYFHPSLTCTIDRISRSTTLLLVVLMTRHNVSFFFFFLSRLIAWFDMTSQDVPS